MIDLALLRRRSLATANLAAMGSSAALFGVLILLPFYLTAVLGFRPVQLALAITPVAASFMLVAPLAGRTIHRIGSDRQATGGLVLSACGALWMAATATGQDYGLILPGLVAFGVGLAVATSPMTLTAIHDVPPERLGVASALPNIFRYIGGALGGAMLGALLHAHLTTGLDRSRGRLDEAGRTLVAEGFRAALVLAAAFLVLAALAAAQMPRLDPREPGAPVFSPRASVDAPLAR